LLHSGHIKSLQEARSHGDVLIVGLNSNASVKAYKSKFRPIIDQEQRAVMLAALECVDYIEIFEEADCRNFLANVKPNIHVKSKSGYTGIDEKPVVDNGGKIVLVDDFPGLSTTNILNKIIEVHNKEENLVHQKIVKKEDLPKLISKLRAENKIIVTTNGAFDILHIGHIESLMQAKKHGDVLIVGLNSDASIKSYKAPERPINLEENRAAMLAALAFVDYVTMFEEDDPRELLKVIKPNVHVKSKAGYKGLEKDVVEGNGGKIVLLEDLPGKSTSVMIDKIFSAYKKP